MKEFLSFVTTKASYCFSFILLSSHTCCSRQLITHTTTKEKSDTQNHNQRQPHIPILLSSHSICNFLLRTKPPTPLSISIYITTQIKCYKEMWKDMRGKREQNSTSDLASALIASQMESAAESSETETVTAVEFTSRAKPFISYSSSSFLRRSQLRAISERKKTTSLLKHDVEGMGLLRFEEIFQKP